MIPVSHCSGTNPHSPISSTACWTMRTQSTWRCLHVTFQSLQLMEVTSSSIPIRSLSIISTSVSSSVTHEIMHCIWNHIGLMWQFKRRGKVSYPDGTSLPYDQGTMKVQLIW